MSYNTSHFRPFLIFKSLSNRVRDIEYRKIYYSNHSLLFLELKISRDKIYYLSKQDN